MKPQTLRAWSLAAHADLDEQYHARLRNAFKDELANITEWRDELKENPRYLVAIREAVAELSKECAELESMLETLAALRRSST